MAFFGRFRGDVTKSLIRQAASLIANHGAKVGEAEAEVLKKHLLEKVREHPVCMELESFTTPSRYVPSKSGTATLFGYLGLNQGSDPVGDLIDFLDENLIIKSKRKFVIGKKIVTTLTIPSKDDMNSDGRLAHPEMTGISWPVMLEEGMGGYANSKFFLQHPPSRKAGRSGMGIQIENPVRGSMGKIKFLSAIFKDFRAKFGGKE